MVTPSRQPRKVRSILRPFFLKLVGGSIVCLLAVIVFASMDVPIPRIETRDGASSGPADSSSAHGPGSRAVVPPAAPGNAAGGEGPSYSPTVRPDTGAFKRCRGPVRERRFFYPELHDHSIVVSCRKIHYKLPTAMKNNRYFVVLTDSLPIKLLVGILSSSAASGESRRQAIRKTWGRNNNQGIFNNRYFVVGGTDFSVVEREFHKFKDMIWLDMDESYVDLMYKTGAMLGIFEKHVQLFEYVLKTDDDTYNNIPELYKELSEGNEGYQQEYFGHCHVNRTIPYRPFQKDRLPPYFQKFIVNKTVYPEKWNAPYCQGAGYIIGPAFLSCIGREIADIRYHPFEDVAIGLVAERCGIQAVRHSDQTEHKWHFRVGEANLTGKILQHPVETPDDMLARHETIV